MGYFDNVLSLHKNDSLERKVEIYNEAIQTLKEFIGLNHPVLGVQLVKADSVEGNDYNPNKVAPPEMQLLKTSIRKDGMTMPVVVAHKTENGKAKKHEYVVVDGFHRTTVVQHDKGINESLGGYLPVSILDKVLEERVAATVRHNMARGNHQTELSAKLVVLLKKHNWSDARIGLELGMEPDEVLRLKQQTGLAEAFAHQEFSKAWTVKIEN